MAGPAEGFRVHLRTQFATLEGSHPDVDPIPNTHIVKLDWTRYETVLKLALSPVSEMELQMPYDIKDVEARYELPDGTEFENPQGNLHHRTEKLEGFSDFKLLWNFTLDDWRLSAGVNLPVGDTVEDPYALGDLGLNHQHIQFGTGTCDPLARVSRLVHLWEGVNLNLGVGAHVPLVENRHGYQGPPMVDSEAGARVELTEWMSISATYSFLYQGRAYWSGVPDVNTGYTMQGIQVTLPINVGGTYIFPSVYKALRVDVRDDADTFELDWIATLAVEVKLGGASPESPPTH